MTSLSYIKNISNNVVIKGYVDTLAFELSMPIALSSFDYENPVVLENTLDEIRYRYERDIKSNAEAKYALEELFKVLEKQKNGTHELSREDIKEVYLMIRYGELFIDGSYDRAGRFWVKDGELLGKSDNPSTKYRYKMHDAAMTSYFVKAVADKYNCKTKEDLISQFSLVNQKNVFASIGCMLNDK